MNLMKYLLILPLLAFFSCNQDSPATAEEKNVTDPELVTLSSAQMKNAGIQLGSVSMENMRDVILLNGVVDVPPQNTVSISFPIAAFLKKHVAVARNAYSER